jgi:Fe-Mn family superoxide dismutase
VRDFRLAARSRIFSGGRASLWAKAVGATRHRSPSAERQNVASNKRSSPATREESDAFAQTRRIQPDAERRHAGPPFNSGSALGADQEEPVIANVSRQTYPFSLPDLPYAYDALEPHIDQKTLQLHHRGHHNTYVQKLNEALQKETALHGVTLEQLLSDVAKLPEGIRAAVANNGGGHVLHDFFWNAMKPAPNPEPRGALAEAIKRDFGTAVDFRKKFSDASAKHFASGWVTLVLDHGTKKLEIVNLKDHTVPDSRTKTALIILDVWEHAYYLKYQNRRPEFIEAFWNVVNWTHAEEKFAAAAGSR